MLQDVGSNIATPLSSAREAHLSKAHHTFPGITGGESWLSPCTGAGLLHGVNSLSCPRLLRSLCLLLSEVTRE